MRAGNPWGSPLGWRGVESKWGLWAISAPLARTGRKRELGIRESGNVRLIAFLHCALGGAARPSPAASCDHLDVHGLQIRFVL